MKDFYPKIGKRLLDLSVAVPALVLLSPALAATALLIRCKLGLPVLFRHQRPGFKGQPFKVLKFRTMTDAQDALGNPLPDADRLTPFGRALRRSSLDELPELWNVIKGEMSLVGPRPLLMNYLPLYSPAQMRRHDVRPGITGWAQINGRNTTTWPQRFVQDGWYVDHLSLWLDLKILVITLWKVLKREGINEPGVTDRDCFLGKWMSPPL
ncbi:MAG: sugar transferase [Verrucomicrobiota bacterium]